MTPLGSISGNVSEDTDNDDIGEEPLSGVTIMLLDSSGGMVSATETDALGTYVFCDLPVGDYQVKETDPSTLVSVSDIDDNGDDNLIDVTLSPTTTSTRLEMTLWTSALPAFLVLSWRIPMRMVMEMSQS